LSDHWSHFLLSLSNGCGSVGVSFRDDLGGVGLCLLDYLGLNELGLGNDLVVFQIRFSIDLIDQS
jgi:hypothetical protein